MEPDFVNIFGAVGAAVILTAFILNQLGKWDVSNFKFDLFNLAGSLLLLIYSISTSSTPFILTNTVWAIFSFRDVMTALLSSRKKPT